MEKKQLKALLPVFSAPSIIMRLRESSMGEFL
jgi:hypothetical protein